MTPGKLKSTGIGCFVLCAFLLFVAWERYSIGVSEAATQNAIEAKYADKAANPWTQSSRFVWVPRVPAATKYSLFFAALSGIGGVVCLVLAQKHAAAQQQESDDDR